MKIQLQTIQKFIEELEARNENFAAIEQKLLVDVGKQFEIAAQAYLGKSVQTNL
jgi:hypothetical protein